MAERKPFLLRLDPETFAALLVWAADDLRSVNGHVEFLLRRALRDAGRLPAPRGTPSGVSAAEAGASAAEASAAEADASSADADASSTGRDASSTGGPGSGA